MKKNYKRLIKKNFEQKKELEEKVINYMSNGKVMIIHLIAGLKVDGLTQNGCREECCSAFYKDKICPSLG